MTGYLTNIDPSNKDRVEKAAKASGFNVEYRDHPKPKDYSDPEDEYYTPIPSDGSIYSFEPADKDHSPFWREYDKN